MPRRTRVFIEGGIYHAYSRSARGADLFSEPEEAIEFIEILRTARVLESPAYLDRLIAHIHLDPAVVGVVDDPAEHGSSGHRALPGKVRSPLADVDGVLAVLLGQWPEAVSRSASRGAEMRLESDEFHADYERVDGLPASGRGRAPSQTDRCVESLGLAPAPHLHRGVRNFPISSVSAGSESHRSP